MNVTSDPNSEQMQKWPFLKVILNISLVLSSVKLYIVCFVISHLSSTRIMISGIIHDRVARILCATLAWMIPEIMILLNTEIFLILRLWGLFNSLIQSMSNSSSEARLSKHHKFTFPVRNIWMAPLTSGSSLECVCDPSLPFLMFGFLKSHLLLGQTEAFSVQRFLPSS